MMTELRILFTGDFCPQGRIEQLVLRNGIPSAFSDIAAEFRDADLSVVDLECPLFEHGRPIAKTGPNLKAHPAGVEVLRYLGVNLVAMANNHILDYGIEGLNSTLGVCASAGIATVGVGANALESRMPFVSEINGRKVAIINITENEWSNATDHRGGANPLDLVRNYNDIRSARDMNDIVIVVFHGGNEFYELPSPRLKETFHFFVDAGASAVIAHHTHIVSGYEVYRGAPVFYGLGNFCFDWPGKRNSFWNKGIAVRLRFRDEGASFDIIPFVQNDASPGIFKMPEGEAHVFMKRIESLNDIIGDDGQLREKFEQFCGEKRDIYDLYLQPYRLSWLQSLRKRKWLPSLLSARKKRLILNLTRCEAHRDVMIKTLEE